MPKLKKVETKKRERPCVDKNFRDVDPKKVDWKKHHKEQRKVLMQNLKHLDDTLGLFVCMQGIKTGEDKWGNVSQIKGTYGDVVNMVATVIDDCEELKTGLKPLFLKYIDKEIDVLVELKKKTIIEEYKNSLPMWKRILLGK